MVEGDAEKIAFLCGARIFYDGLFQTGPGGGVRISFTVSNISQLVSFSDLHGLSSTKHLLVSRLSEQRRKVEVAKTASG